MLSDGLSGSNLRMPRDRLGEWIARSLGPGELAPLGPADLAELVEQLGEAWHAAGTVIFREGDAPARVHVVRAGAVALCRSAGGRRRPGTPGTDPTGQAGPASWCAFPPTDQTLIPRDPPGADPDTASRRDPATAARPPARLGNRPAPEPNASTPGTGDPRGEPRLPMADQEVIDARRLAPSSPVRVGGPPLLPPLQLNDRLAEALGPGPSLAPRRPVPRGQVGPRPLPRWSADAPFTAG